MTEVEVEIFANLLIEKLNSGVEFQSIIDLFIFQGHDFSVIANIKAKAYEFVKEDYYSKVLTHLLDVNLEEHLDEFPLASNEEFEKLQWRAKEHIFRNANKEVDMYYAQQKTIEEICDLVVNPYYGSTDVLNQIKRSHIKKQNEPKRKNSFIVVVAICITLVGCFLVFASANNPSAGGGWQNWIYSLVGVMLILFAIFVYRDYA